ncbi:MAG: hypothetical protein U0Q04_02870 [Microbacterium sp.]
MGSSSYYFRSRAALLEAAVARLADLDVEAVRALNPADPTESVARLMEHALSGSGRTATLARYELSLEAARRPELRQALVAGTERLQSTIAELLAAMAVPSVAAKGQARDLLAFLDGVLFAEVTGAHGSPRSPAELRAVAEAILGNAGVDDSAGVDRTA